MIEETEAEVSLEHPDDVEMVEHEDADLSGDPIDEVDDADALEEVEIDESEAPE